jgi:hypothetical protein
LVGLFSVLGYECVASRDAVADLITFPVGTPITVDQNQVYHCERSPFSFSRFGGLSINTLNTGGVRAGGLRMPTIQSDFDQLTMSMGGQAFSLSEMTFLEAPGGNPPTGLRVAVNARTAGTLVPFDAELLFDLNPNTYDVFNMLSKDPRFANIDRATFDIESPFVDPVSVSYILDSVVASPVPEPNSAALLLVVIPWALKRFRNM